MAWRVPRVFTKRRLESKLKVWVEFRHGNICEGSPPGRQRRRRQSRQEGGQAWNPEKALLTRTEEHFRELEKFWLGNGVEIVT